MKNVVRIAWVGLFSALLLGAAPASQPAGEDPLFAEQMKRAQQQVDRAESVCAKTGNELAALRDDLRKETGRGDVSPEGVRQALKSLQEQQEKLQLEHAGAEGRRKGLMEAIDQMTSKIQKKAQSDDAVGELEQVLKLREQAMKRIERLSQQNAVSPEQLEEAQVRVADARLKLIEVRRQAVGTTNAESLDVWNRELMNLSIDEEEREARLHLISQRLNELMAAMPRVYELERLMGEAQHAEALLRDAQLRLSQVEQARPL